MIFARRGSPAAPRFTIARVTLFFFAAGLWLAGVAIGNDRVTVVAIGIGVLGIALGLVARRSAARAQEEIEPEE